MFQIVIMVMLHVEMMDDHSDMMSAVVIMIPYAEDGVAGDV